MPKWPGKERPGYCVSASGTCGTLAQDPCHVSQTAVLSSVDLSDGLSCSQMSTGFSVVCHLKLRGQQSAPLPNSLGLGDRLGSSLIHEGPLADDDRELVGRHRGWKNCPKLTPQTLNLGMRGFCLPLPCCHERQGVCSLIYLSMDVCSPMYMRTWLPGAPEQCI